MWGVVPVCLYLEKVLQSLWLPVTQIEQAVPGVVGVQPCDRALAHSAPSLGGGDRHWSWHHILHMYYWAFWGVDDLMKATSH